MTAKTQKQIIDSGIFKVGDKVKITRRSRSKVRGWDNVWVKEMTRHIGYTVTIRSIFVCGVYFEEIDLGYPIFVLEKVKK